MNKKQLEEFVTVHINPLFNEDDIYIYDQEFVREGDRQVLRFYIDKDTDFVGIEDCEYASGKISDKLDETDPIEESYYLEVSSPGIDHPFRRDSDFIKNIGKDVLIKFYEKIDHKKEWICQLKGFDNMTVTVEYLGKTITLERSKIATIRLSI